MPNAGYRGRSRVHKVRALRRAGGSATTPRMTGGVPRHARGSSSTRRAHVGWRAQSLRPPDEVAVNHGPEPTTIVGTRPVPPAAVGRPPERRRAGDNGGDAPRRAGRSRNLGVAGV